MGLFCLMSSFPHDLCREQEGLFGACVLAPLSGVDVLQMDQFMVQCVSFADKLGMVLGRTSPFYLMPCMLCAEHMRVLCLWMSSVLLLLAS